MTLYENSLVYRGALKSQEWTSWHQVAGMDIAEVDIEGVVKQQ